MDIKYYKLQSGISLKVHNIIGEKSFFSLAVKCGSKNDNEFKGIAHFLEHMLLEFNIENEQDIYIKGTTTINKTIYILICPNSKVNEVMNYVKQIVYGYSLQKDNMEKVRNDVYAEYWKKHQSKTYKVYEKFIKDAEIAEFLPIGTIAGINNISYQDLSTFYKENYQFDNICLSILSEVIISPKYVEDSFLNHTCPENRNIRIENKKQKKMKENNKSVPSYFIFFQSFSNISSEHFAHYELLESVSITYLEEVIKAEFKIQDDFLFIDAIQFDDHKRYIRILIFDKKIVLVEDDIENMKKALISNQKLINIIKEEYNKLFNQKDIENYQYIKYMADCYIANTVEYDNDILKNQLTLISIDDVISFLLSHFCNSKKYFYKTNK